MNQYLNYMLSTVNSADGDQNFNRGISLLLVSIFKYST